MACRFVPASFAWFSPPMYAPGLGFLMFAVGVNLKLEAFKEVFKKPQVKITHFEGHTVEVNDILCRKCGTKAKHFQGLNTLVCLFPVHCGWSCWAVAGQTSAGAHPCADIGTNARTAKCCWHRLDTGAPLTLSSFILRNAITWHMNAFVENLGKSVAPLITFQFCSAGVVRVWGAAVELCDILGAPRASSSQHCSDCSVHCGGRSHDPCTCAAAAGCPHTC